MIVVGGFEQQPASSVLLQPRSLLIFCDQAYEECLHGIDEVSTHSTKDWATCKLAGDSTLCLCASTSLLSSWIGCSDLLQITADEMHGGIANLEWTGLQPGDIVERKGERISLTVRRILKTRKNILRL